MTAEMVQNNLWAKETQDRSKLDHTWTLLQTKGYFEASGLDNVYKSETAANHCIDEKAISEIYRERDHSRCVRRDEVLVWHEKAIQYGTALFPMGDRMKF